MCDHLAHYCWRLAIPHAEKMIIVRCAMWASPDGSGIYPGLDRLGAELGFSRSTVAKYLKLFVDQGVLVITEKPKGGRGRTTEYALDIERLEALFAPHEYAERPRFRSIELGHAKGAKHGKGKDKPSESRTVSDGDETENRPGDGLNRPGDGLNRPGAGPQYRNNIERIGSGDADAVAAAPNEGAATAPLNAHWRSKLPTIEIALGELDFNSWIKPIIVEADDGEELILSLPTRFLADHVRITYGGLLAEITERKIEIIELTNDQRAGWLEQRRRDAEG